ncbi:MAG: glycogen synthase [Deltaproteobacteria bacterium RIFOXYA12_FULL_61_11]|nr:MAG: glycogen synthase [Deltaproteobacteria bacterium RIFOXYA12_FULL_61_11]
MESLYEPLLVEIAWEVCNQVGGIYTVIRSKVAAMVEHWGDQYCLVGPYLDDRVMAEFEVIDDLSDPFGRAVKRLREQNLDVLYGRWLVTGKPRVVLLNPACAETRLNDLKYILWDSYRIDSSVQDELVNNILAFGEMVKQFLAELANRKTCKRPVIAHFHEWLAASCLPDLAKLDCPALRSVFTTHATQLGRYLAMNDVQFYQNLYTVDVQDAAKHYGIETQVHIERMAAQHADVLTTVSEVTGRECEALLGRKPEVILPNGLNIKRFAVTHEVQNLHQRYKERIHTFVMAHFFHSYSFDLDETLYFFTAGRYEFVNKGYDLVLEAMRRLNTRMKRKCMTKKIILFIVTKRPYHTINPQVFESRAAMEEIHNTVRAIKDQIGERLFYEATAHYDQQFPQLNDFVDEYWRLRYRRIVQSWKTSTLPIIVTHNLVDDRNDEVLNFLRRAELFNKPEDPVGVIYHPDFITTTNPLFNMEYNQFVRGCHLGIFPSYYEPWGYTPLECIASGVPAITSDLAGFGTYVMRNLPEEIGNGITVVKRNDRDFDEAADQLTYQLLSFVNMSKRERIFLRNHVESLAEHFAWEKLVRNYEEAYRLALQQPPRS